MNKIKTTKVPANTPYTKKESLVWDTAAIIILISILGIIIYLYTQGGTPTSINTTTTMCIANSSTLYATEWCGYCQKQKSLFGTNVNLLNVVDCDKDKELCIMENIKGFPTWKINNKSYFGLRYEDDLRSITGC